VRAVLLLLLIVLAAPSCGGAGGRYGDLSLEAEAVDIETLLEAPELHLGKEVRVQGQVVQVCQVMGCWFEVMAEDKRLMVDLQMGRDFTIPEESAGLHAEVVGTFVREEGVLKVVGHGVELRHVAPD
jgi:hypothetical protein